MLHFARTVLPFKTPTADWWKTLNSQSGSTKRMVLKCNTESKTEYTIWKNTKNWTEKCCQLLCSILFVLFYCMTRAFSCSGLTCAQIQSEAKSSAPAADPLPDPLPPFLALPSGSLGMEYCMTARQVGWVESPLNRSTPWKETPEKRHQSVHG